MNKGSSKWGGLYSSFFLPINPVFQPLFILVGLGLPVLGFNFHPIIFFFKGTTKLMFYEIRKWYVNVSIYNSSGRVFQKSTKSEAWLQYLYKGLPRVARQLNMSFLQGCGSSLTVPGFLNVKTHDIKLLRCLVWQTHPLNGFFYLHSFVETLNKF